MANYAASRRNAIQYQWSKLMASPEFKMKPSAAISALKSNLDGIVSSKEQERMAAVKKTDQDTVEVNLLNKQSASLGSARAYNHTGSINDSTATTLTFTTISDTFKYSIKQADRDSVFSLDQMVAAQMVSKMIGIVESLETAMITAFNTNKSQVSNTPSLGVWNGTSYIYEVPQSDKNVLFQRLKGFMGQNYYKGMYQMISDEAVKQWFEYLAFQGAGNQDTLNFQMQNIINYGSTELTPIANTEGHGYIFPMGTAGLVDWIPQLNKNGWGNTYTNGGVYYSLPDPWGLGLTFAVHEYAGGADNQSAAGERQDVDIEVELSIDHSFIVPTFSTSNLSAIYKFQLDA